MGIGNREKNFRRYLDNHFGIKLPPEVHLFYAKGVRVGNPFLMQSTIHGELGYAACDFGFNPTTALIQNFGHLATKNIVKVTESEARAFVAGSDLNFNLGGKRKYIIVKYDSYVLGFGEYDPQKNRLINRLPPKVRRTIINSL
ncbi:hypothetical protein HY990_01820 [Candidatus Micrarchaeota archaeon]|nr:hypothetical protein [Candidatus Micrarchaeota archaeon]